MIAVLDAAARGFARLGADLRRDRTLRAVLAAVLALVFVALSARYGLATASTVCVVSASVWAVVVARLTQ